MGTIVGYWELPTTTITKWVLVVGTTTKWELPLVFLAQVSLTVNSF